MPVFAVSQKITVGFNGLTTKKNSTMDCNDMVNTRMSQTVTKLVDTNYGRSLVRKNNISFGANLHVKTANLTEKISAALQLLKYDEIIVVGKNREEAITGLNESVKAIPAVLNKIYFIAEEKMKTPFAIFKDSRNIEELVNLGADEVLKIKTTDRNKIVKVGSHTSRFITDGDEILANGMNVNYFDKISYPTDDMNDIKKAFIQEIDLSTFQKEALQKLNSKKITQVGTKATEPTEQKVTFKDVKGQDEAIEQMKEHIVRRMKYPNFYKHIKFGKNALLVGPPGTGKTLGARACANELDIPFFYINPQTFEDMFIGNSSKKITAFYDTLRKSQPCMTFFDEVEATFGRRNGVDTYREASLNLHLEEISKLEAENADVYMLAASNRPELIDRAMLRDGRFGTQIEFNLPTVQGCKDIFELHSKEFVLDGVDIDKLAETMHKEKFSGANIAGLISDTALASARRLHIFEQMDAGNYVDAADFKHVLTQTDFDKTMEKKIVDVRNSIEKYEKEREKALIEDYVLRYKAQEVARKEIGETKRPNPVGFGK